MALVALKTTTTQSLIYFRSFTSEMVREMKMGQNSLSCNFVHLVTAEHGGSMMGASMLFYTENSNLEPFFFI